MSDPHDLSGSNCVWHTSHVLRCVCVCVCETQFGTVRLWVRCVVTRHLTRHTTQIPTLPFGPSTQLEFGDVGRSSNVVGAGGSCVTRTSAPTSPTAARSSSKVHYRVSTSRTEGQLEVYESQVAPCRKIACLDWSLVLTREIRSPFPWTSSYSSEKSGCCW